MFKIDSDGATAGNLFTEGNPALSEPATVVSADWLNAVQTELVTVVEENGITLDKNTSTQLNSALLEFFLRGGRKNPVIQTIDNNSGPNNIASFVMNKSTTLAKIGFYYIERKTATQNVQEAGVLFCLYDSADDVWHQSAISVKDDAGVEFSIDNTDTDAAVLQYTSDDLTGATYVGTARISAIFELRAS